MTRTGDSQYVGGPTGSTATGSGSRRLRVSVHLPVVWTCPVGGDDNLAGENASRARRYSLANFTTPRVEAGPAVKKTLAPVSKGSADRVTSRTWGRHARSEAPPGADRVTSEHSNRLERVSMGRRVSSRGPVRRGYFCALPFRRRTAEWTAEPVIGTSGRVFVAEAGSHGARISRVERRFVGGFGL